MKKDDKPHPFSLEGKDIPESRTGRFLYWMKNKYWYYYRFHTAGIIFAILAVIFIVKSYKPAEVPDFTFVLASEERVDDSMLLGLSSGFSELYSDDDMQPLLVKGVALYIGGENEMINAQRFSIYFVDEFVSCFIVDGELEEYWGKSEYYIDLSKYGIETIADKPWLADVTLAMSGLGIDSGKYYACIQAVGIQDEDSMDENARFIRDTGINFVKMLLENA